MINDDDIIRDVFKDDELDADSLKQQLDDPHYFQTISMLNNLKDKISAAFKESHEFSDSMLEKIERYSNSSGNRNLYFSLDSNTKKYTVKNYPNEIFLETAGFSYAEKNQLKIAAVSALMLKEIENPQKEEKSKIKNSLGVLVKYMHKEQLNGSQDAIERKTLNTVVEFCKKFLFDFTNSVKSLLGANKKTLSFEDMITYSHSCQINQENQEKDGCSQLSKEIKNVWKSKY